MSTRPPAGRTPLWQPISEAAAKGRLMLQVCASCSTVQYPPREVCVKCLGADLNWEDIDARGSVLSWTAVHASLEPFFQQRSPWPVASIQLDCGPVVLAQLSQPGLQAGARVMIVNELNDSGQSTFWAHEVDRD